MPVLKYRDPNTGQFVALAGGGVTDHGLLTGLGDDDHPQYLTQDRGDLRYLERAYAPQNLDWNTKTEPGPVEILMLGNGPNGPGPAGSYYYLTNYVYGGALGDGIGDGHTLNVTQVAQPYGTPNFTSGPVYRSRFNGTWGTWVGMSQDTRPGDVRLLTAGAGGWSIANNAPTALTGNWVTTTGDTGNGGNLVYSGGQVYVSIPGYYDVTIYTNWAGNTAGNRRCELLIDGSAYYREDRPASPSGASATVLSVNGQYMNANQYFQVQVFQTSGGALNLANARWNVRRAAMLQVGA